MKIEKLASQEEQVMIYFCKLGPSFIWDVLNEMLEPKVPYTSVLRLYAIWKKKYLSPFKISNSIKYYLRVKKTIIKDFL